MIQRSSRARRLSALTVFVVVAAITATSCHSKASGGELMLTGATEPGANAFMPSVASAPPTNTQPPPTLQSQGDGNALETQPVRGDHEGLYGGVINNSEVDRDAIVDFLAGHPAQASAFVESLNIDNTVYWSGGRALTVDDIHSYLHELTAAVLRLDTRITNHGFDGRHFTTVQSVFQAGTPVLVDAHGVPRVSGLSGNPLTEPVALRGEPKLAGAPWPGYHPGALAMVQPSGADIKNFVLVDVVTGKPFNRPAGTIGRDDTPHPGSIAPPGPAGPGSGAPGTSPPPAKGQDPLSDIDGTYVGQYTTWTASCNGPGGGLNVTVTHEGHAIKWGRDSGTLDADGSFLTTGAHYPYTDKGVFAAEGGRMVVHGTEVFHDCTRDFVGTKQ
jgi:hypothetical protein